MKLFLIPLAFLLLGACKPPVEKTTEINDRLDPAFFKPTPGQIWLYRETVKTIPGNLSREVTPGDITTEISTRRNTYLGPLQHNERQYHRFSIHQDDEKQPDVAFGYNGDFLFVAAKEGPQGLFDFSKPPVPLAQRHMQVGSFWSWPPGSEDASGFRTVSLEEVRTPAGAFDAFKVTFQHNTGDTTMLQDYWFAPKVGIVREESSRYRGGLLRAHSTIELLKIQLPTVPEKSDP
ncbi:MAG: TapB family protein [Verrucomicrobiaceae bacterium]